MIDRRFIQEMESIVGKPHVSLTRTGIELYSYDASLVKGDPGIVVFPADTGETARVVRAANRAGVDFLPRGFGTNLSGGTISVTRGLVICMSRFNKILKICPHSRYAVVQPGVTNLEVQEALGRAGAFYAPDPASQKVATLGGNAGENSGGPRCLKYGVTTNHILGMEAVMADGEVLRIGGPALDPPGLDLRGLLVGSEGAFAVITELTLRTLPKTESVITMLAVYDDLGAAARSVSNIISAGMVPNTLEMMDATVIEAVEANAPCGYPEDAAAVLIIEVEGMALGLAGQADRIKDICMDSGCRTVTTAKDEAERDRLWQGRRGAFGAIARLAPNYLVNDACVPRTLLPEALEQVGTIADRYGCRVGNVFHAGDGNLHPLLLFDSRNPTEVEQVHRAGWDIMAACVALGGTISGEHGIGREKQAAMSMIFSGDDLKAQQAVKSALDPVNRLNPDKIIPRDISPDGPTVLKRAGGASAGGVGQAMAAVREAAQAGKTVKAAGAGHFRDYGNARLSTSVPVSTDAMTDIIEYDPANLFITAGTGLPLADLQALLTGHNQWLPVRPPRFRSDATTGALAALGFSGPERMFYGAPRDLALGLQYIDSRGRIIATGGKVVKNVAGYDMTRLMIGSGGSLGLITEVTWRVVTRPVRCLAVSGTGGTEHVFRAANRLMNACLFPVFIVAVPKGDASSGNWQIRVGFEGLPAVVEHQAAQCRHLLDDTGLVPDGAAPDYDLIDGPFRDRFSALDAAPFLLRASGPLESLAGMYQRIRDAAAPGDWFLDLGCGRIFAGLESLDGSSWQALYRSVPGRNGHLVLEKASRDFRRDRDVFPGTAGPERAVMHRIKQALDPDSLFDPACLPTPLQPN